MFASANYSCIQERYLCRWAGKKFNKNIHLGKVQEVRHNYNCNGFWTWSFTYLYNQLEKVQRWEDSKRAERILILHDEKASQKFVCQQTLGKEVLEWGIFLQDSWHSDKGCSQVLHRAQSEKALEGSWLSVLSRQTAENFIWIQLNKRRFTTLSPLGLSSSQNIKNLPWKLLITIYFFTCIFIYFSFQNFHLHIKIIK